MHSKHVPASLTLSDFSMQPAQHEIEQSRSLVWLAQAHAAAETTARQLDAAGARAFEERIRKVIERCACGPDTISKRGHVLSDVGRTDWQELAIYDVLHDPRGQGTAARARVFDEIVSDYFAAEYAREDAPPGDLIHVTCTGYSSPSGAQRLVADKGWGTRTRVTHAYQMGCYAAFPALRVAAGFLHAPPAIAASLASDACVDIVHTELCSLHMDPSNHALEQLVVQSLFADGFIRYRARLGERARGLQVLAISEALLPDSADAMSWTVSDAGMRMTLARDVPQRIAASLRDFVTGLYARAGMTLASLPSSVFAVHPGGPRILDGVRDMLELTDAQLQTSRDVLFDHGNMSSATLPHIWQRLIDDQAIAPGALIVSLAFGPGLTVCGGLFRKA